MGRLLGFRAIRGQDTSIGGSPDQRVSALAKIVAQNRTRTRPGDSPTEATIFSRLDDDGPLASKIRGFQLVLTLVVCAEYWTKALARWSEVDSTDAVVLAAVTLLATAVIHGNYRRRAFAGLALLQLWYVWSQFPQTGNHRYLELFILGLFAVLDDRREDERRLLLRSLRFVVVVVLFYSGVQKLVHGYWFQGQFLAFSLWRDGFGAALEPLLSSAEIERLSSYGTEAGDGPYLVSSPLFVLLSNAVWIAEIALALLLIPRRTRTVAVAGACVLLVCTEAVARELMFGLEFVSAILLFARRDLVSPLVRPVVLVLLLLVLVRLGLLPEFVFH